MIKYPATKSFHAPSLDAGPNEAGCTITNLCDTHAPRSEAHVPTTSPGETCELATRCQTALERS